ncbi:hypothetical protein BC828DRAFT_383935 [Blastocladiella britannica]|nr:hypothetical protein BC828DRAFT_383935 [Blastocladiella britannica]
MNRVHKIMTLPLRLYDIGVNLADPMFRGRYHGKQKHADDFDKVLARSKASGVESMMLTGTTLSESREVLEMTRQYAGLVSTVGCHPTRCNEFRPNEEQYLADLLAVARDGMTDGKIVAIGECGLDYDRLHFCKREVQLKYFARQFELASETGLPMFLHDRNTGGDMHDMLRKHRDAFSTGVVHSFTGTLAEMKQHVDLDLYIGINGCSLKTEENLQVLREIPLDRLMLETDAPWCEIKPTHASHAYLPQDPEAGLAALTPKAPSTEYPFPGFLFDDKMRAKKAERWKFGQMLKSRNEPCDMVKVLLAAAAVRGESVQEVAEAAWENTQRVFHARRSP